MPRVTIAELQKQIAVLEEEKKNIEQRAHDLGRQNADLQRQIWKNEKAAELLDREQAKVKGLVCELSNLKTGIRDGLVDIAGQGEPHAIVDITLAFMNLLAPAGEVADLE